MTTWLDELEARLASARCSYIGRCNSSRCPLHGGEARALRKLLRVARAVWPLLDALDDCEIEHVGHECPMWPEGYHGDECTCGARFVRERAEALRAALRGES